jgi:DNA-binding NarL/FixJ family response regulator
MIRVLLVDDQSSVRLGLRMRLGMEADLAIVGEAADGGAAVELAERLQPDVVIMDVDLPYMDGITATAALQACCPRSAVIILSLYGEPAVRERAQAAGAVAFVEKPADGQALVQAIRRAAAAN